MCSCHYILECCIMFSGVKLSMGSFVLCPIHYTNPLEEPSNETRCMLLKLNVILNFTPENRPHLSSIEVQPYTRRINTH